MGTMSETRRRSRKFLPEKNFLLSSRRTIPELPIHDAGSEGDAVKWRTRNPAIVIATNRE